MQIHRMAVEHFVYVQYFMGAEHKVLFQLGRHPRPVRYRFDPVLKHAVAESLGKLRRHQDRPSRLGKRSGIAQSFYRLIELPVFRIPSGRYNDEIVPLANGMQEAGGGKSCAGSMSRVHISGYRVQNMPVHIDDHVEKKMNGNEGMSFLEIAVNRIIRIPNRRAVLQRQSVIVLDTGLRGDAGNQCFHPAGDADQGMRLDVARRDAKRRFNHPPVDFHRRAVRVVPTCTQSSGRAE